MATSRGVYVPLKALFLVGIASKLPAPTVQVYIVMLIVFLVCK